MGSRSGEVRERVQTSFSLKAQLARCADGRGPRSISALVPGAVECFTERRRRGASASLRHGGCADGDGWGGRGGGWFPIRVLMICIFTIQY